MITTNAAGTDSANATSFTNDPTMSADGRFVAFASKATNLVSPFTDGNMAAGTDVFARGDFQPTASLTANPSSGLAPLAVSVDGSGSSDPDGSIASYAWNFGDGGTAMGATATHNYGSAGSYTATLTVTDDDGDTAQAQGTITVTPTAATGQRAAAKKRCKKKFPKGPRRTKCLKKAKRLPV
jgi:PKD repeat protein